MARRVVASAVRSSALTHLVVGILLIAMVVGGMAVGAQYLTGFFSGPQDISNAELGGITDLSKMKHTWVNIKGTEAFDTGWEETSRNYGIVTNRNHYLILALQGDLLLVEVHHTPDENETLPSAYTGSLSTIPAKVQDKVIGDIRSQSSMAADALLPFMLDTGDYRTGGYIGLGAALLGFVAGGFLIMRGVIYLLQPHAHPIRQALARYGEPRQIEAHIDQELSQKPTQIGRVTITPHWAITRTMGNLKALRLEDVAWLYLKVTRHRTNGIPTGKTFEAQIYDRHGSLLAFQGKQKKVEEALNAVQKAAPWAVGGYDDRIAALWKTQRKEFLSAVEARKQQANQGQTPTAE